MLLILLILWTLLIAIAYCTWILLTTRTVIFQSRMEGTSSEIAIVGNWAAYDAGAVRSWAWGDMGSGPGGILYIMSYVLILGYLLYETSQHKIKQNDTNKTERNNPKPKQTKDNETTRNKETQKKTTPNKTTSQTTQTET